MRCLSAFGKNKIDVDVEVSNSKKRAIWADIQVKVNSCGVAHRSRAQAQCCGLEREMGGTEGV